MKQKIIITILAILSIGLLGYIIFDKTNTLGNIDNVVYDYSTVNDNKTYYLFNLKKSFKNFKKGNYETNDKSQIYPYLKDHINNTLDNEV